MSKPGNVIRFTTTPDGADEFAAILERAIEHAVVTLVTSRNC